MADLIEAADPGLTARALGDQQGPHRFHRPVAGLGHRSTTTPERRAGGFDRVEPVGLAVAATLLTVGSIHLDHLDPGALQEPGQAGAVGAGALDPHPGQVTEADQPAVQIPVAAWGGRERLDTQDAAVVVQRGGDVHIEVGVDSTGDRTRALYDGHCHPFSRSNGQGVARTSREGDRERSRCCCSDDRSPSGTGRAPFTTASDAT